MEKLQLLTVVLLMFIGKLSAQTQYQNTGWFMVVNNTKFNEKWGLQFDFQVRSADKWDHVRNTLVRPALQYFINKNSNVALGYLWQTTQMFPAGGDAAISLNEHRIFEQYIYNHKMSSVFFTHRIRLEQRFIGRGGGNDDLFSQRFRYFFRLIQPLQKAEPTFTKGAFVALQNEVFLNLQNNNELNNHVFDQNRAYLALGYRFSNKVDVEAGYMNQAVKGQTNNTLNNIIQLAVYTRF